MYFVSQRHEDKEYNVENEQAFDLPYLIQNVAILYWLPGAINPIKIMN